MLCLIQQCIAGHWGNAKASGFANSRRRTFLSPYHALLEARLCSSADDELDMTETRNLAMDSRPEKEFFRETEALLRPKGARSAIQVSASEPASNEDYDSRWSSNGPSAFVRGEVLI